MRMNLLPLISLLVRPFGRESVVTILRLWLGLTMMYHGFEKVMGTYSTLSTHLAVLHIPAPELVAGLITAGQLVGGIMIAMGFATRPVLMIMLLINSASLVETLFFLPLSTFSRKGELALTYLLMNILLFVRGPGSFSIDGYLYEHVTRYAPYTSKSS
jgi:putative oxidoreductase